jgi:hypothetical protein
VSFRNACRAKHENSREILKSVQERIVELEAERGEKERPQSSHDRWIREERSRLEETSPLRRLGVGCLAGAAAIRSRLGCARPETPELRQAGGESRAAFPSRSGCPSRAGSSRRSIRRLSPGLLELVKARDPRSGEIGEGRQGFPSPGLANLPVVLSIPALLRRSGPSATSDSGESP